MKKMDLGKALAILANLGVIVGIAFLAVELNQANRIGRYTAENARRNQFIQVNSIVMDHSEIYAKLQVGVGDLTPPERAQALSMARMMMNSWFDAEAAYEFGLLSEGTFQVALNEPAILMQEIPGLAPFFGYLLEAYEGTNDDSQVATALAEALRSRGVSGDGEH